MSGSEGGGGRTTCSQVLGNVPELLSPSPTITITTSIFLIIWDPLLHVCDVCLDEVEPYDAARGQMHTGAPVSHDFLVSSCFAF